MQIRWGLGVLAALALIPVVAPAPGGLGEVPVARAANDMTPWTSPTMPPLCTAAQIAAGDVSTCLLDGPDGQPETRGWPTPPFPTPDGATVVPWTDLKLGDTGSRVTTLQRALIAKGYSLAADGIFGSITERTVKSFQVSESLPETGIVDAATAGALGILETAGGAYPPAGWTWIGWAYNGSEALKPWESALVANTAKIGVVQVRQIRSFPDAYPLFAGFVADIQAGGYTINDAGTYAFRCTSNSRKDCEGQTREQLSNHAYGLALDINTAKNPELTYRGVDGASACATPVKTDIPKWMVDTAQKWGLYWGGYGWTGNCTSPAKQATSVLRDSMHFEFRGSPAQAKAIIAFNASGATPRPPSPPTTAPASPPTKTCLPQVDDSGAVTTHCLAPNEVPARGVRTVIRTGAPAGATAAVVNVTVTGATAAGYVTAEACTASSGERTSSNANAAVGINSANLSVVPIAADGTFCLYQSTPMHTVVDVQGFFSPASAVPGGGNLLAVVPPQRLLDSRVDNVCLPNGTCPKKGPVPADSIFAVATPLVPPNAVAMLANLTVTGSSGAGYLTADSCSALVSGPQTRSNTNVSPGATVANLAVVPTGASAGGSRICAYTSTTAHEIVDLQGFFVPAAAGGWGFTPATPTRLLDTRACTADPSSGAQVCADPNAAGSIVRVQGPAGQSAALVNLTITDAAAAGYITADACSVLQAGPQTKSNGNLTPNGISANIAVVPLDPDGSFCIYTSQAAHLVVDIQGSFSPAGALRFQPITPVRVHDSRVLNTP